MKKKQTKKRGEIPSPSVTIRKSATNSETFQNHQQRRLGSLIPHKSTGQF